MTLYERITDWNNLYLAYRKAAKGKRGKGPAARFEYRLEDNLVKLQQELADKSYRPGQYNSFCIHEPKRRLISAAPFRDRLALRWAWLNEGQYQHAARMIAEIGRLLGGWQKKPTPS